MIPTNVTYPEFVPDQLLTSDNLNELFGYLDEHSPEEVVIGNRGGAWILSRASGEVYDAEDIYGRPSLLAHIDELAETYGTYQRREITSS